MAAALADDRDHRRCVEFLTTARRQHRPMVVPTFVAAETCYMLARESATAEAGFLRSFTTLDRSSSKLYFPLI